MTTISDKDRADAQAMAETLSGQTLIALTDDGVRLWLAVRDRAFASHTCPQPEPDSRIQAWMAISKHPFFADCYNQMDGTLLGAVLDKLDTTQHLIQSHTCEQAWRPTTAEEIQPGWEVRSRRGSGSEAVWGTVHHQDIDGDWRTEGDILLTYEAAGWTYETTAPLSAPDPRIAVVMEWYGSTTADHAGIAGLLARLDNLKVVEYSEPHSN